MKLTAFFALLGGLLVLAFVANRQFHRTRVPDVVVLMGVGLLIGPVLGLVDVTQFHRITEVFGTLAIILILFAAGLELNLKDTVQHFWGGLVLGLLAYLLSFGAVTALFRYGLSLDWTSAMLVGAVLGCTSGSIVIPVIEQMQLREPVKVTLLMEASLGDVLAVLTVKVLLDYAAEGGSVVGSLFGGFLIKMLVALVLAGMFGFLWSRLLPVLSEQRFWHVLTFAMVLLLYAGAEIAQASGLIAVLGLGLILANFPGVDPRLREAAIGPVTYEQNQHHQQVLTFHAELAFLVRTFFFVLLGAVVQFGGLRGYLLETAGVLGALWVARWMAVKASGWSWKEVAPENRELVLWMIPRGLITAVLAIQVLERRGEQFAFLPALTFAVILVTNLMVVFGSIRHRRAAAAVEYAPPSFIRLGG